MSYEENVEKVKDRNNNVTEVILESLVSHDILTNELSQNVVNGDNINIESIPCKDVSSGDTFDSIKNKNSKLCDTSCLKSQVKKLTKVTSKVGQVKRLGLSHPSYQLINTKAKIGNESSTHDKLNKYRSKNVSNSKNMVNSYSNTFKYSSDDKLSDSKLKNQDSADHQPEPIKPYSNFKVVSISSKTVKRQDTEIKNLSRLNCIKLNSHMNNLKPKSTAKLLKSGFQLKNTLRSPSDTTKIVSESHDRKICSSIKSSNLKSLTVKSSNLKSLTAKSSNLKSLTEKSSNLKSSTEKSSNLKPSTVKLSNLKSSTVKSSMIQSPNMKTSLYTKSIRNHLNVKVTHGKPFIGKCSLLESSNSKSSVLKMPSNKSLDLKIPRSQLSLVKISNTKTSIVKTSNSKSFVTKIPSEKPSILKMPNTKASLCKKSDVKLPLMKTSTSRSLVTKPPVKNINRSPASVPLVLNSGTQSMVEIYDKPSDLQSQALTLSEISVAENQDRSIIPESSNKNYDFFQIQTEEMQNSNLCQSSIMAGSNENHIISDSCVNNEPNSMNLMVESICHEYSGKNSKSHSYLESMKTRYSSTPSCKVNYNRNHGHSADSFKGSKYSISKKFDNHANLGDWMSLVDTLVAEHAVEAFLTNAHTALDTARKSLSSLSFLVTGALDVSQQQKDIIEYPTSILDLDYCLLNNIQPNKSFTYDDVSSSCEIEPSKEKQSHKDSLDSHFNVSSLSRLSEQLCSTPLPQIDINQAVMSTCYNESPDKISAACHSKLLNTGPFSDHYISSTESFSRSKANKFETRKNDTRQSLRSSSAAHIRPSSHRNSPNFLFTPSFSYMGAPSRNLAQAKGMLLRGIKLNNIESIIKAVSIYNVDPNGYLSVSATNIPWMLTAPFFVDKKNIIDNDCLPSQYLSDSSYNYNKYSRNKVIGPSSKCIQLHPLHLAVAVSSTNVIKTLIDLGSCVNALDEWHRNPLHILLQYPVLLSLMTNEKKKEACSEVQPSSDLASSNNSLALNDAVNVLVQLNQFLSVSSTTRNGNERDITTMLCEYDIDLNRKDVSGKTCYDYISEWRKIQHFIHEWYSVNQSLTQDMIFELKSNNSNSNTLNNQLRCSDLSENNLFFHTNQSPLLMESKEDTLETNLEKIFLSRIPESVIDSIIFHEDRLRLNALRPIIGVNINSRISPEKFIKVPDPYFNHSQDSDSLKEPCKVENQTPSNGYFSNQHDLAHTPNYKYYHKSTPSFSSHSHPNDITTPFEWLNAYNRLVGRISDLNRTHVHEKDPLYFDSAGYHSTRLSLTIFPSATPGTKKISIRPITRYSNVSSNCSKNTLHIQLKNLSCYSDTLYSKQKRVTEKSQLDETTYLTKDCVQVFKSLSVKNPTNVNHQHSTPSSQSQYCIPIDHDSLPLNNDYCPQYDKNDITGLIKLLSTPNHRFHPAFSGIWEFLGATIDPQTNSTPVSSYPETITYTLPTQSSS